MNGTTEEYHAFCVCLPKKNFLKSVRSETINLKLEKSFWPHTQTQKAFLSLHTL